MKKRNYKLYAADFETTVYEGQKTTAVWASAIVELYTEDVILHTSIEDVFEWIISQHQDMILYYHNLKFDGSFWLNYLLRSDLKCCYELEDNNQESVNERHMPNNSYTYCISDMGQWYSISIKVNNRVIRMMDSYKLLPFSLERIGKSFKTKHQKLEMEYVGNRYPGWEITDDERAYIESDALVLKEALEYMLSQGHTKSTIGSCCLAEYKSIIGSKMYSEIFYDVYNCPLPDEYGVSNAGEYIRKSYRGGYVIVAPGKERKKLSSGVTLDVNSLYPSVMHSMSGNFYPVGQPTFWRGDYIPDEARQGGRYYFLRIRTRFYLRKGKLPCIQIKNTLMYRATQYLETSDIYGDRDGLYHTHYIDFDGSVKPATVTLTLTQTDFALIKNHYELVDCEILDGCYFEARIGLFDEYIDKYAKIKQNNEGAARELAKLFLNNLYGKIASNTDSSFKIAYLNDKGALSFITRSEHNKKPVYIPIGSAITSYARNFTIRAAQLNYHGPDSPGFCYADTDSIHCDMPIEQIKGVTIDSKKFCCWKHESSWDTGWFVRAKTYIEVSGEDVLIKCAGMPDKCKELFIASLKPNVSRETYSGEYLQFVNQNLRIEDFDVGLSIPGKLTQHQIEGGIVLTEVPYTMR